MGTNIGISAAYQASALSLNGRGKLTTLELSRSKVAVAIKLFGTLKLKNIRTVSGKFQDTLEDQLEEHKPIDFVFVDGHHNGEAIKGYFNQIAPRLSGGALVIFDDIEWSSGMRRAWKHLKQDPRFSTTIAFLNFGVCILKAAI